MDILALFAHTLVFFIVLAWLAVRIVRFFILKMPDAHVQKITTIVRSRFFGFFRALFKFLAVGACWLFLVYLISMSQDVYRDMNTANYLRKLLSALEPLQADIAAQLEAAGDATPPIAPEKARELTDRIPDLDRHNSVLHETVSPISWKAVLPDGSIALFSPPASAFFLLRPTVADGKTTWTCHAAATRGNILPGNCRTPPPTPLLWPMPTP
jgi:hypothetical protein